MCGIAGFIDLGRSGRPLGSAKAQAEAMAATLVHRGPDDAGVWEAADGRVALAHRRLSIIDLSPLGRNPMSWHDGRLWITFNGEIYNFLELRRELEDAGYRFKSQTDTEVILAAYDRWGLESVDHLVGMFAFALWDGSRHRLWLVRDRLGKKPLYYAQFDGCLRFASELKAFLVDERFPRRVDPEALRLFLRYGYVPSPFSIYAAAKKLPPAHFLVCENGSVSISRYWDPVPFVTTRSAITEADALGELEGRLSLAVRQRRLADVPLGAFLSGGIDSSLVVAMLQEQSSTPVRTFSIRFENPEFNEADHAAAVARHLGTDHYEETCSDHQLFDIVDKLPDLVDEPFADSSTIPTYLVSRIARQRVTVALSGDGGDELFFGYPRYWYHEAGAWAVSLPRPLQRAAARVASNLPKRRLRRIADVLRNDDPDAYSRFITWWDPADVTTLTGAPAGDPPLYKDAQQRSAGLDSNARVGLLDLVSYLPDDILTKVDRASMAVSLEVRAPLLDHRVVEFALGLPLDFKRRGRDSKWILRQLLYRRVPQNLLDRPKMGFGVPLGDWFRGPLRERMEDFCSASDLEDLGLEPRPVRELWSRFKTGLAHREDQLWQIYALIAWARRFRTMSAPALAQ
jgi:asparagine synthase (glutamine-hydrolysing)